MKLQEWKFFDGVRDIVYNQDEVEINERNEKFLKTTKEKLDDEGIFLYPINLFDKEGKEIWEQDLVIYNDKIYLVEQSHTSKSNIYQMVRFPLTRYKNEKPIRINNKNANETKKFGCALNPDWIHSVVVAESLDSTINNNL